MTLVHSAVDCAVRLLVANRVRVVIDMLEVGTSDDGVGLSPSEERAHFALWAVVKAPLLIGANLAELSPEQLALLSVMPMLLGIIVFVCSH